jgi:hypothetical protein
MKNYLKYLYLNYLSNSNFITTKIKINYSNFIIIINKILIEVSIAIATTIISIIIKIIIFLNE